MKTILKKLFFFIAFSLVIISCDDSDEYYYYYDSEAFGIISNASPNSGDLYFYADDNQINSGGLNYTGTQGYYRFYTGERTLSLRNEAGTILDSESVNLDPGKYFSVFAVNTYDKIELAVYEDQLEYPGLYKSRVRFINLSPDAPEITIKTSSKTFAENLSFKENTSFIEIEDGLYTIQFIDSTTGNVLHEDVDVEFYPGRVYTIYSKGFVNPPEGSNDTFSSEKIRNL